MPLCLLLERIVALPARGRFAFESASRPDANADSYANTHACTNSDTYPDPNAYFAAPAFPLF
jgi:hypothetical protein